MKLLVVKLSSLGDVIHTFPALTDIAKARPDIEIDWVVEEAFVPIARLHPAVRRTIAFPLRRLRKAPLAAWRSGEAGRVIGALQAEHYDVIVDAQGLMKSAIVARLARGAQRHGFDRRSAREPMGSLLLQHRHFLPEVEQISHRIRRLFALALGLPQPEGPADTGLDAARLPAPPAGARPYMILLHGTAWRTKEWPSAHWRELTGLMGAAGYDVALFAQGAEERRRAEAIAADAPHARVVPPAGLADLLPVVAHAAGAVTVDTGLGHIAAAFGVPTVGLYGPTDPDLAQLIGPRVTELRSDRACAPCQSTTCRIAPEARDGMPCLADRRAPEVWAALRRLMPPADTHMDSGGATVAHHSTPGEAKGP
ncbi:lipopolysaccharide heptosyltransferase I [Xanthobacter variabilis]|uniref:lipopolysaccharide heptosyltransferase I n=1 Tax=Xanthobacter variabilis TaxID=3119932 RepID=UPI00374F5499